MKKSVTQLWITALTGILSLGVVFAYTAQKNLDHQALAAVPGVSCSGAFFGTTNTSDSQDITSEQFLARFPTPTIVKSVSNIAKVYGDGKSPSTENLKYGASSSMGKFTLNLNRNITGVKMGLKYWAGDTNKVVIVNGVEYTVPSSDVYTDHEFTFAETNTITFSAKTASKNRGYISYISFYY
jgi:hypothetical protein